MCVNGGHAIRWEVSVRCFESAKGKLWIDENTMYHEMFWVYLQRSYEFRMIILEW